MRPPPGPPVPRTVHTAVIHTRSAMMRRDVALHTVRIHTRGAIGRREVAGRASRRVVVEVRLGGGNTGGGRASSTPGRVVIEVWGGGDTGGGRVAVVEVRGGETGGVPEEVLVARGGGDAGGGRV